jgi:ribonucleoside-diphosphate reductase alpha chain
MNLHGYLARERVHYGSEEGIDFTNIYFYTVVYHAIRASNLIAIERGKVFGNFENSKYASGEFFDKYTQEEWLPATARVAELFANAGIAIPTQADWNALRESVMKHGIYNQNLQAVPPTGSISYINNSTSSIHPVASKIEIRKEGKLGRVYYPAPFLKRSSRPMQRQLSTSTRVYRSPCSSRTPQPPAMSTRLRSRLGAQASRPFTMSAFVRWH